jgi:hypothetical protein
MNKSSGAQRHYFKFSVFRTFQAAMSVLLMKVIYEVPR